MQNRWIILAVLTTTRLTMGFQFQSIGSTAQFLVDDFGINYASVGFLIGLYLLPGIVLALPAGFLGKRFGDKRMVVAGLVFMAMGGIIVAASNEYELVVVGRFVSGVGMVFLSVLLTKMMTDWFADRELVLAMAIFLNSWPIGVGLALIILGPLAEASSWPVVFYVTSAAAMAGLLLVAIFYRNPDGSDIVETASTKFTALSLIEAGLVSLAGMVWALFNVAYAILWGFTPSLLIARGMSIAEAGFIISFTTGLLVVSVQIGGILVEKYGRANAIMTVGIIVFGVGMLLLPSLPSVLWVVVLIGAFGGLPAGAIVALPAKILRPENRGPGMGLFITWYFIAMAALPPVAGWFQDITGTPAAPVYFGGFVMLAAVPFLGLLRVLQRQIAPSEDPTPEKVD